MTVNKSRYAIALAIVVLLGAAALYQAATPRQTIQSFEMLMVHTRTDTPGVGLWTRLVAPSALMRLVPKTSPDQQPFSVQFPISAWDSIAEACLSASQTETILGFQAYALVSDPDPEDGSVRTSWYARECGPFPLRDVLTYPNGMEDRWETKEITFRYVSEDEVKPQPGDFDYQSHTQ